MNHKIKQVYNTTTLLTQLYVRVDILLVSIKGIKLIEWVFNLATIYWSVCAKTDILRD
jgi:hypothetical protein